MSRVESEGRYAVPVPSGVRLIASDLDGTLLLSDGSVGSRTRASLDRLSDSDLDLIIVTGRPPRWISPIVEMTGHRGVGIAANGAVGVDAALLQVQGGAGAHHARAQNKDGGSHAISIERTKGCRGLRTWWRFALIKLWA